MNILMEYENAFTWISEIIERIDTQFLTRHSWHIYIYQQYIFRITWCIVHFRFFLSFLILCLLFYFFFFFGGWGGGVLFFCIFLFFVFLNFLLFVFVVFVCLLVYLSIWMFLLVIQFSVLSSWCINEL